MYTSDGRGEGVREEGAGEGGREGALREVRFSARGEGGWGGGRPQEGIMWERVGCARVAAAAAAAAAGWLCGIGYCHGN